MTFDWQHRLDTSSARREREVPMPSGDISEYDGSRLTDEQVRELVGGIDAMIDVRRQEMEDVNGGEIEVLSGDIHDMELFRHGLLAVIGRASTTLPLSTGECNFGFKQPSIHMLSPRLAPFDEEGLDPDWQKIAHGGTD